MMLRPHQIEPVDALDEILRGYQSAVDLSDTGVGKTYVAAAVAARLRLPTLVVCPKIVITAWHRAASHFNDTLSVINYEALRTGRSPFGYWKKCPSGISQRDSYYICQCCQRRVDFENFSPCYCHPNGIHCVDIKKMPQVLGDFVYHDAVKFVVADEVHRCGGIDSLNAEMLIAAKRQNIKVLGLSATAALSPLGMRALGYNLDLHGDKYEIPVFPKHQIPVFANSVKFIEDAPGFIHLSRLPNFYQWASRYGCRRDQRFHGFKWVVGADKQVEIMREIRDSIIPARGVRVRVQDIPGFPQRDITAELYDINKPEQIDALYAEMAAPLQRLAETMAGDKAPDNPLTRELRARQRIELLKVPACAELASDYIDKGYSLGIFVNFRQTLDELCSRFPDSLAIYGGQPDGERESQIDAFQSNDVRLIVIMSDAGGVGLSLPDVTGNHPRGGLVMPSHRATVMRQIFGRFHRDDSKSNCWYRVLLAAGTLEQPMYRNLNIKFNNLDALNDADLTPEGIQHTV